MAKTSKSALETIRKQIEAQERIDKVETLNKVLQELYDMLKNGGGKCPKVYVGTRWFWTLDSWHGLTLNHVGVLCQDLAPIDPYTLSNDTLNAFIAVIERSIISP
jgi:hypothetical protein